VIGMPKFSEYENYDTIYDLVVTVFPLAEVDQDNEGQWIIYTNIGTDGELKYQ